MIRPQPLLRLGWRGLLVHRLRSVLSVLGVLFGVAAVVAMSSVGEGARREALEQVGALGIDGITLRPGLSAEGEDQPRRLRLADAEALSAVVPHLVAVAPLREVPLLAVSPGGRDMEVTTLGTLSGYQRAARLVLASGRFLSDLDARDRKRTVVLGATVASRLFPLDEPIGRWITLGGDWFEIVGVLASRAQPRRRPGPIRGRDVNLAVFVPLPSLDRGDDVAPDGVDEIALRVSDGEHVKAAATVTRRTLKRTNGGNVQMIVPREILAQRQRTQRLFSVVTGAVAGLGLLVGGIGIMNIMLASVAERTSEVGLRRAVGATRNDVAAQFLVEAGLLTLAGGVGGAAAGTLGSYAIQYYAGWPTALSAPTLVAALFVALAVGIGFGSYPAWRAAHLEPMVALRLA